jgi:hypothetical protein
VLIYPAVLFLDAVGQGLDLGVLFGEQLFPVVYLLPVQTSVVLDDKCDDDQG